MTIATQIFIAVVAAISAALAAQAAAELMQRFAARARAMSLDGRAAAGPLHARLSGLGREAATALAFRVDERLPKSLRQMIRQDLESADQRDLKPGHVALGMLAASLAALAAGLLLGLGLYAALAALAAFFLPWLRLRDRAKKRRTTMRKALPDALDLLCSCVQAGLGFNQALLRVAGSMGPGPLRQELESAVSSMRMGSSRRDALLRLKARVDLQEMHQLAAALVQADQRGVELGPVLKVQSGQMRSLKSLRVRKLAAQAPLKMLFPLMVFIMPVIFIVIFVPVLLKWTQV